MPRILQLINASEAGGLSRYVIDLAVALRARGTDVIVAGDKGAWHDRFIRAGLDYRLLPLNRGAVGFLRSVPRLAKIVRDEGIDLIHSHYRKTTLLARTAQRRKTPPILYTLHLTHLDVSGVRGRLSDFGDHTHLAAADARDWAVKTARIDPNRITVIPHGIDADRWPEATPQDRLTARAELGIDATAIVQLFVGRLDSPKNESWVIDAHRAARHTVPNLVTLLVGDGPNRKRLESNIGPDSTIRLLGERPPLAAYHAADLLVLPSSREGFSYVCAEALCTGLPILRTRTTGTSETVVENITGRSVEIDHDAFVNAAVEMLSNPAALVAMRTHCALHARGRLSFTRQIDATLELYDRLTPLAR